MEGLSGVIAVLLFIPTLKKIRKQVAHKAVAA